MSIDLRKIIDVSSSVISSAYTGASLVANVLSKNPLIPINDKQRCIPFTNAELVGEYFGIASAEYDYAVFYFKGYDGQLTSAPFLVFSRYVDVNVGAYIRSGVLNSRIIPTVTAITSGSITFKFSNTTQVLAGLDFTNANSFSLIAGVIQTALDAEIPGATATYSSISGGITVQIPSTSAVNTVDYCADGPLAELLNFTQLTGAVLSQGMEAQSPKQNMIDINAITKNWQGFNTLWENSTNIDETLELASWNSTNPNNTVFAPWTNISVVAFSNMKNAIDESTVQNIFACYSDYDFVAFQLGMLAAVNYNATAATVMVANKSCAGIIPLVKDNATYDIITALKGNFYGEFASRATIYNFSEDGSVTGIWKNIEAVYNEAWLDDALQNTAATYFKTIKRSPYNNIGYTNFGAIVDGVMSNAVKNGTADINVVLSQTQIQAIIKDAGYDISEALFDNGYYYQVVPATPEERQRKDPIVTNIWYTSAGSWNKVKFQTRYVQ